MPRLIEIVLFLAPFLTFAAWRLWFPSPVPPPRLMYGMVGLVVLLLATLLWLWHFDAEDTNQPYIPDELHNGRAVPAQQPAAPP